MPSSVSPVGNTLASALSDRVRTARTSSIRSFEVACLSIVGSRLPALVEEISREKSASARLGRRSHSSQLTST